MRDFNFRDQLIEFPYRNRNYYSYGATIESSLLLANDKYVPFIVNNSAIGYQNGYLPICTDTQFRGRRITKDKVVEILNTAKMPLKVELNHVVYYVGKGYIGKSDSTNLTQIDSIPLLVYTYPRVPSPDFNEYEMSEVTLLVSPSYKMEPKTIKTIVDQCIDESRGDVIITNSITKFVTGTLSIPKQTTISEKKRFDKEFVEQLIPLIKDAA